MVIFIVKYYIKLIKTEVLRKMGQLTKKYIVYTVTGIIFALIIFYLTFTGNPKNMGVCVGCFIRDTSGAVNLHHAKAFQYIRPEIIGIILGSFAVTLVIREKFSVHLYPFTYFFGGVFTMIGVLIFLGCTVRVFVRLGGGDLNAVFGLLGMIAGIGAGTFFIKKGFSLPEKEKTFNSKNYIYVIPVISVILFLFLILKPGFISFSDSGIGSQHAPVIPALTGGLIIGIMTNYFDLGFNSGFRNLLTGKMENPQILFPVSIVIFLIILNFMSKNLNIGFIEQPAAHSFQVWNFLGLFIVGWIGSLLQGCPLQQLVKSAKGNLNSIFFVTGMFLGAGFLHRIKGVSTPKAVPFNGKISLIAGLIFILFISVYYSRKKKA